MTKKAALIGDLHFSDKRLPDLSSAWTRSLDLAVKEGASCLLQAGDAVHYFNIAGREASFGTVLKALTDPLIKFPGEKILIRGNHDSAGPGQDDALTPFDYIPSFRVAHTPQVFQGPGLAVACLPWLTKAHLLAKPEYRNLPAAELENIYAKKVSDVLSYLKDELASASGFKILLAHCEIPGAKVSDTQYMIGGNFEIDQVLLERVGADRIVLGHIHKRQGWYLGALTQLNFGDEGNPQGFEMLDLDTGESEFIEIDSPRYWTFTTEELVTENSILALPKTDHIKIKGTELPTSGDNMFSAELPANVQFEKVVEQQVMTRRFSENLDPDSNPVELLKIWVRESACTIPVEDLIAGLTPLLSSEQTSMSAIGSLQRIKRMAIKNLACHKDTNISLPDGLTAITGPNGSGKTFLLESPLATLYGIFPSRPGNIFDCAPIGDSSLEVEFESDGHSYTARRDLHVTPKTKSQTGYLISEGKTLAGGPAKLDDFESACKTLVGDPDLLMASIVSSQNLAGDLVDAKPSERQELFRKLLGLEKFAPVSLKARELGKVESGRIQEIETLVKQATLELEGKPELLVRLEQITAEIGQKQVNRLNLEKERDGILAKKEKASQIEAERTRLEEEKAKVQKELRKVDQEIAELEAQKKKSEALLASEPEVQKKVARREELLKLLMKSKEQELAASKYNARVKELGTAISNKERELETSQKSLKEKLTNIEVLATNKRNSRIKELETVIVSQERELKSKQKNIQEKLKSLKEQAAILKDGDFGFEPCQTCQLLTVAHLAENGIDKIQKELDELIAILATNSFCLEEKKEKDELKSVSSAKIDSDPEVIQIRKELDKLEVNILEGDFCQEERKELEELKANPVSTSGDVEVMQNELYLIMDSERLLGQIEAAKAHKDSIELVILKASERKTELEGQWAEIKDKQLPTSNLLEIEEQISQTDRQILLVNAGITDWTVSQGKTQSEIERLEKLAGQIEEKKAGLEASRKAIEVNDTLDRAFGKDGIPQLLIDSAIPQLHDILNGLLSGLDNRFAISFSTQRALDKGGVKECLEILVADQVGSRDISLFSGGEQRLLRTILRLSWAIFQAQRSGKRLEVFFSDESFDALDRDNAVRLLKIFGKLQGRFNQVIIVSHDDLMIADLPNVIRLEKKNGQTEVVQ